MKAITDYFKAPIKEYPRVKVSELVEDETVFEILDITIKDNLQDKDGRIYTAAFVTINPLDKEDLSHAEGNIYSVMVTQEVLLECMNYLCDNGHDGKYTIKAVDTKKGRSYYNLFEL